MKIILLYSSVIFSCFVTLLQYSLRIALKNPKLLHYLKRGNVLPKLVTISIIFHHKFFGKFGTKHPFIQHMIVFISLVLSFFGTIFRIIALKYPTDFAALQIPDKYFFAIFGFIFLHTIFRSFVSFSVFVYQNFVFEKLFVKQFFNQLKSKKWVDLFYNAFDQTQARYSYLVKQAKQEFDKAINNKTKE